MVGADSTIELGVAIARPEADLTVVGLAGGGFDFRFGATAWEVSLSIPYWGSESS